MKKYYFEKEAQVHTLQNTLAHQRLSQSRTSLDDSEYIARFGRLEGLIGQLAFSIRKSWKAIPDFLARAVNKDAVATGKQEMTAVGKAFISHWIMYEVFDRFFHPDLDIGMSLQLKQIFNNIRRYCPPFQSSEEEEALNSKLVNWRLTTFDGLQDRLRASEAAEHQQRLIASLNDKLISDMSALLQDPAPPDLAGGVYMIVELAIKIAAHFPLESRDVIIDYYLPGALIVPDLMKVETGIPALTNPILPMDIPMDAADHVSLKSTGTGDTKEQDRASVSTTSAAQDDPADAHKKRGMFGIMSGSSSKKPAGTPTTSAGNGPGPKINSAGPPGGQGAAPGGPDPAAQAENKEQRVRLSVGISVQIRGRSVLAKAPVYAMS